MDLNNFMDDGIRDIVETVGRFYAKNPRGLAFLARTARSVVGASKVRASYERRGTHVPGFLIASIASECNLNCAGCYARANSTVGAEAKSHELTDEQWARVFEEAAQIGVSFMLLAGGEPTLRRPVLDAAARTRDIIFPVFTNGIFNDPSYLDFFDENRNVVPIFSIEGDDEFTDARRGAGVAARVRENIDKLAARNVLWGASVTVTTENLVEVTSPEFISDLYERGCGAVIFVEYVPVAGGTYKLALDKEQGLELMRRVEALSASGNYRGLVMRAFPGSEEELGGCLAAGRGFFHISQAGGAEPCPFSPFSVANVAEKGLLGVIDDPFFAKVREVEERHAAEHTGGCTLFMHQSEVREALAAAKANLA